MTAIHIQTNKPIKSFYIECFELSFLNNYIINLFLNKTHLAPKWLHLELDYLGDIE